MIKNFLKNFWIKLFCLIAAILLWVYVAAGQNTIGKFPGNIKIRAINVPAGLVASYDSKTVDIKVMADPSVWRKLSADTFSAYVDLSAHSEGTYELPVNVVSSIPGVQIVEKTPDKIIVSLEPIITKEVNINKKIEGSAGNGLVPGEISLEPDKVSARGPKSKIESLTEATVIVKLNGETDNFTKTVTITSFDESGEEVADIEFMPSETKASVLIVKASNNKTVGVKVNTTGSPKTGYFISAIDVTPSTVDVTGSAELLDSISYVETFAIDVTNQSNDFEKEIGLKLLSGSALQANSNSKVKVKIKFLENSITKEIIPNIFPKNLDSSRLISQTNPVQIRVVCSGPASAINNLKGTDVTLWLDFSEKKFNQGPSSINFDIKPSDFSLPSGVTVESISPSFLTATVEKKN